MIDTERKSDRELYLNSDTAVGRETEELTNPQLNIYGQPRARKSVGDAKRIGEWVTYAEREPDQHRLDKWNAISNKILSTGIVFLSAKFCLPYSTIHNILHYVGEDNVYVGDCLNDGRSDYEAGKGCSIIFSDQSQFIETWISDGYTIVALSQSESYIRATVNKYYKISDTFESSKERERQAFDSALGIENCVRSGKRNFIGHLRLDDPCFFSLLVKHRQLFPRMLDNTTPGGREVSELLSARTEQSLRHSKICEWLGWT
jgi:hypothetical protein